MLVITCRSNVTGHCAWLQVKEDCKNIIVTASQLSLFIKQPKQSGFLKRSSDSVRFTFHCCVLPWSSPGKSQPELPHTSALFCLLRDYFKIACLIQELCFSCDMIEHMVAWVTLAEGKIQFAESLACLAMLFHFSQEKRDEIFSLWNTN